MLTNPGYTTMTVLAAVNEAAGFKRESLSGASVAMVYIFGAFYKMVRFSIVQLTSILTFRFP